MEFTEFAQLLHPIIGGASSTHAFVKTLFDAIVTDDGRSVLEEVKEDTYKAYFNGNTGISRIAKKISPYIEPEEFVEFCDQFQDATTDSLCDSFRPHLPEINSHNAGELLASLFQEIIKNAASVKRKSTTKSLTFRDAFQLPVTFLSCYASAGVSFISGISAGLITFRFSGTSSEKKMSSAFQIISTLSAP